VAHADVTDPASTVDRGPLNNGNPAPAVRMAQRVGDSVFNQDTRVNSTLDNTSWGRFYHAQYGYPDNGQYPADVAGTNGEIQGILNTPYGFGVPAVTYAAVGGPKECNLRVNTHGGVFVTYAGQGACS
jgi:hypothetical protein